jgi:hypothetical protein
VSDTHGAATDGGTNDVAGTDAGAEDNFDAAFEAMRAEDAALDVQQPPAEAGTQAAAEPAAETAPAEGAADAAQDQEQRQPLTVEEYQRRHRDITEALRQERLRSRAGEQRFEQAIAELRQRVGLDADPEADPLAGVDVDKDPIGAIEALLKHMAGQQQLTVEQRREEQKRQASENARRDYEDRATTYESEVVAEHPDYPDALQFVMDRLVAERVDLGYAKDVAEAEVDQLVYTTTQDLMRRGVNPARYAYGLAVKNGYKPGAAATAAGQGGGTPAAQPKPADAVRRGAGRSRQERSPPSPPARKPPARYRAPAAAVPAIT